MHVQSTTTTHKYKLQTHNTGTIKFSSTKLI